MRDRGKTIRFPSSGGTMKKNLKRFDVESQITDHLKNA